MSLRSLFESAGRRLFGSGDTGVPKASNDRVFIQEKHACPACRRHIEIDELEQNLFVCPGCDHHFRITAMERLGFIIDAGTFEEFAGELRSVNPLDFPGYEEKLTEAQARTHLIEAVVTGTGSIKDRRVVVGAMSFHFMGGSMGSVVGEKITRALLLGAEQRLPVIIFTASGGARMQEGIFSLMQMAKTAAAVSELEARGLPLVVVLTDPTTGGVTASFAMLGNVILAEPGAMVGFAGRRVAEGTIRQKLPENFQRAESQLEKGFVDAVVPRKAQRDVLSLLLRAHMQTADR